MGLFNFFNHKKNAKNHSQSDNDLRVVRSFEGHLRIKSKRLFNNVASHCLFAQTVFSLPGIEKIKVNPLLHTGLITYNPEQTSEEDILEFSQELLDSKETIKKNARVSVSRNAYRTELNKKRVVFKRYGEKLANWEIIHQLPGRLRLRHPLLHRQEEYCYRVEKALYNTPGVENPKVNAATGSVLVTYDETALSKEQLIEIMEEELEKEEKKNKLSTKVESGLPLAVTSMGFAALTVAFAPLLIPLSIGLVTYTATPTFKEAWQSLKRRQIKVDILDAIVVSFCLVMNQIVAAALMVWILEIAGKVLASTQEQSKKFLTQIFGKQARFAWLLKDGQEMQISVEKLKKGDVIVVSTGEQVPADGEIIEGEAMFDQQSLTGEAAPAEKKVGDQVFASTTILAGKIQLTVKEAGENTTAAKIMSIINQSANYKTKVHSRGEKIADKMVLPTLGLAAVGTMTAGPNAALAIINADYGTGIRVAAPMAVLASIANASRHGILIKNGAVLETITNVDVFLFDKTGTLTYDVPEVANVICVGDHFRPEEVLAYAASAEEKFTHPIAKAILAKAKKLGLKLPKRDESRYHVGFGIEVTIEGKLVKIGSCRFIERENIEIPQKIKKQVEEIRQEGGTVIMVGIDDQLAGVIDLETSQRNEATEVIRELKRRGKETVLISGDHHSTTKKMAGELGVDRFFAEVLPQDKADHVRKLQKEGKKVAMIGDGVNDSPALSRADVSISLRGASDIATDVADVVFMDGDLTRFSYLFEVAEKLQKNVRRSFAMILIPNTLCIFGAMFRMVGLGTSLLLNNGFNLLATINGMAPLYSIPIKKAQIISQGENHGRKDLKQIPEKTN